MKRNIRLRRLFSLAVAFVLLTCAIAPFGVEVSAQSRRTPPTAPQKKNPREEPKSGEPAQEPVPADTIKEDPATEPVKVATALVNVEAVVYHKKTGKIITGLKKENFTILEDGAQKEITNFSTPDAPITVSVVMEYSKLTSFLGSANSFEPGRYEVLRPMAMFLSQFIKPPDDYVSVVAYDMRPTPITDFTNDPARISQVINLLLRNQPAFSEANLFDALKLVLVGGKADAVVLEDSKQEKMEYAGMQSLQGRRKAVFLISSGIDTFSRTNYGDARKIAQSAGVPIYIIGTGNLFFKKFEHRLDATDSLTGVPGRLTLLQAQNALRTFAKETGGEFFPITFEGELPNALQSINALMRNQYSLGYKPGDVRDGKQRKILVKVDVDGDGTTDDKEFVVRHRPYYNPPKPESSQK